MDPRQLHLRHITSLKYWSLANFFRQKAMMRKGGIGVQDGGMWWGNSGDLYKAERRTDMK